jgi:hypothetical protein
MRFMNGLRREVGVLMRQGIVRKTHQVRTMLAKFDNALMNSNSDIPGIRIVA